MEDILFSRQQFSALINRLEDIRNNVSALKLKALDAPAYIEAHDIIRLYHISKRTLERWRQNGRIPFNKVGNFFYYMFCFHTISIDFMFGSMTLFYDFMFSFMNKAISLRLNNQIKYVSKKCTYNTA